MESPRSGVAHLPGPRTRGIRLRPHVGRQVGRKLIRQGRGQRNAPSLVVLGRGPVQSAVDLRQRLPDHDPAPEKRRPDPASAPPIHRTAGHRSPAQELGFGTRGMASHCDGVHRGRCQVRGFLAFDPRLPNTSYRVRADETVAECGVHHHSEDDDDLTDATRGQAFRREARGARVEAGSAPEPLASGHVSDNRVLTPGQEQAHGPDIGPRRCRREVR